LADVEVEGSTKSKEASSKESNQSSQNDWAQVNQVGNKEQKIDEWLIDSGASVHVMNQKAGLQEPTETSQAVTIGSGKAMAAKAIGTKPAKLCDTHGNIIELADMLYIPEFKKIIISLSKLLDQGYKVKEWTKEYFWLSKNDQCMQVSCKEGYSMYYFQACSPTSEAYMVECTMDINEAHDKMAHMGEDTVQKTMAHYGIKLTGKMDPCNACLHAKARAKNTKKTTECVVATAGKCLYQDHSNHLSVVLSMT